MDKLFEESQGGFGPKFTVIKGNHSIQIDKISGSVYVFDSDACLIACIEFNPDGSPLNAGIFSEGFDTPAVLVEFGVGKNSKSITIPRKIKCRLREDLTAGREKMSAT